MYILRGDCWINGSSFGTDNSRSELVTLGSITTRSQPLETPKLPNLLNSQTPEPLNSRISQTPKFLEPLELPSWNGRQLNSHTSPRTRKDGAWPARSNRGTQNPVNSRKNAKHATTTASSASPSPGYNVCCKTSAPDAIPRKERWIDRHLDRKGGAILRTMPNERLSNKNEICHSVSRGQCGIMVVEPHLWNPNTN